MATSPPTRKLVRGQRHDLVPGWPVDAVILVSEGDAPVVAGDQPVVGDGDAVGVARQIGEHRLGSAEWWLAVDVPLDLARWYQSMAGGCELRQRREQKT